MELCSWFVDGAPAPKDYEGIARKFTPGQLYLCGRVRDLKDGLVTVKVKSQVAGKEFRWLATGQLAGTATIGSKVLFTGGLSADGLLVVRPIETVSPPASSAGSSRPRR